MMPFAGMDFAGTDFASMDGFLLFLELFSLVF
jgi:hypothetical protein